MVSRVLMFFAVLLLCSVVCAETVIYDAADRPGVSVSPRFVGVHSIGLLEAIPGWDVFESDFNYKIGSYRMYGSFQWRAAHVAPGQFDWSTFDAGFARLRRSGTIKSVTWVYFNPPQWAIADRPQEYGKWQMQLVAQDIAIEFTRALLTRYPEIDTIECANEVVTSDPPRHDRPRVGGFWIGTAQELTEWCNRVLNIRDILQVELKRTIRVLAPSIPGTVSMLYRGGYLDWLASFPRVKEFDGIPAHFYRARADDVDRAPNPKYTCFVELRDGLKSRGIRKPILDNEHGFEFPAGMSDEAMATVIYNYFVKAALLGIENVTLFDTSRTIIGQDAYIGLPAKNQVVKAAIEDAHADLAGKTITRVVDPGGGRRWKVTAANTGSR